jgi:hypothetical protein
MNPSVGATWNKNVIPRPFRSQEDSLSELSNFHIDHSRSRNQVTQFQLPSERWEFNSLSSSHSLFTGSKQAAPINGNSDAVLWIQISMIGVEGGVGIVAKVAKSRLDGGSTSDKGKCFTFLQCQVSQGQPTFLSNGLGAALFTEGESARACNWPLAST